jgi:hypothetical protein
MRAPVASGDRVVFWGGREWRNSFLPPDTLMTVDYLLPDYGKIICKLDKPIGPHTSCCLYDDQFGFYWGLASGMEARRAETAQTGSVHDSPTAEGGDAPIGSRSEHKGSIR